MPAEKPTKFLTVREAALWFDRFKRPGQGRTRKQTVYKRIRQGNGYGVRLAATRGGGHEYLITVEALERYVRETDAASMPSPAGADAPAGRTRAQAAADHNAAMEELRRTGLLGSAARKPATARRGR